jgi:hypothetical protein
MEFSCTFTRGLQSSSVYVATRPACNISGIAHCAMHVGGMLERERLQRVALKSRRACGALLVACVGGD